MRSTNYLARAIAACVLLAGVTVLGGCGDSNSSSPTTTATFLFTSDPHYGIKKTAFDGYSSAKQVNGIMIGSMNSISSVTYPCDDGGLKACQQVGAVDYLVQTGDIANRMEANSGGYTQIQSAATSWSQFENDFIKGVTLKNAQGGATTLYAVPGNHDVTNAIGFYKTMTPTTDSTVMLKLYNMFMNPSTALTSYTATDYDTKRIYYSKDIAGVHCVFITMWPDSTARAWIDNDLKSVSSTTPVILFTHDQPDIETKHLKNPNPPYTINATDQFENMVTDQSIDTDTNGLYTINAPSTTRQRELVAWLKTHKNIVAYFHGNDHINGTYTYTGPDNDISLQVVRVDSPMKGSVSKSDPSKLTYKVVNIDSVAKKMTVRDYQWYAKKWDATATITVSLAPRSN